MVGKTLGHYEILEPLGAGGMGEVYRARDTTLKRDVAIKVLPPSLVESEDRLARLKHEAHLLAALNHANIATIHALEEEEGTRFLVLELVKGESLEQRLSKGPLPVEKALDVCKQIAEALEAAHEEGIIHRDLKPANVLITPEGRAKVLDFGLAKTAEAAESSEVDISHSPTVTVAGTKTGVILGTAPYMSPEQVRGKPVDKRTDIWAFGCVLYEMLTGERAFDRETVADTLAAVLDAEPDWSALPAATPAMVQSLLRRCLRKNADRRLHDIADARIEIEEADEPGIGANLAGLVVGPAGAAVPWSRTTRAVAVAIAALAVASGGLFVWSLVRPAPPAPPPVYRVNIEVDSGQHLSGGHSDEGISWGLQLPTRTAMSLSPDGKYLVYCATGNDGEQLYLRRMDQPRATPMLGTEGGCSPFFSPDGQSVGFFADGDLKSVPISGGDPRTILADATTTPFGASWADDDTIVFAADQDGGLRRVAAAGGGVQTLTTVDPERGETGHRLPYVLPGSKAVLFTVMKGQRSWENAEIVVRSLDRDNLTVLVEDGADPRFAPTGHIVFARRGALMAMSFDPESLEVTGEPVRVVEEVMQAIHAPNTLMGTGAAQFTISDGGALAFVPGGAFPEHPGSLAWVDREGKAEILALPPRDYLSPRVSPDGGRLAYSMGLPGENDVYIYDIARGIETRLTSLDRGSHNGPVWSPDGERVAFASTRDGSAANLYWKAADGSGDAQRLTDSVHQQQPSSWSPDGVLAFVQDENEIWLLAVDEVGAKPRQFLQTTAAESEPAFSPDGKWLAYTSDESGRYQVYVRPFPGLDPRSVVSSETGLRPAWSRDGHELFFRRGTSMWVVDVSVDQSIRPGRARLLFDEPYDRTSPTRNYDVLPDRRFVMVPTAQLEQQPVTLINIILNWFEELKELVPTDGSQ